MISQRWELPEEALSTSNCLSSQKLFSALARESILHMRLPVSAAVFIVFSDLF
jgi:hypothetical protein